MLLFMLLTVSLLSRCAGYASYFSRLNYKYSASVRSRRYAQSIRPSLDDVERISRGDAARRRGTGSRAIPHRLNSMERTQWDIAKKKRFLVLRGSGWRKERGDSPLANIYRQFCDAVCIPAISVCQGLGAGEAIEDTVIVDLSPLRTEEYRDAVDACIAEARCERYSSVVGVDASGAEAVIEGIGRHMQEDPIWRVPVLAITVQFRDRQESKAFAEAIADKIAK